MSVQERAQLEGQIAAENLKQTIYQAPSGYQTPYPVAYSMISHSMMSLFRLHQTHPKCPL